MNIENIIDAYKAQREDIAHISEVAPASASGFGERRRVTPAGMARIELEELLALVEDIRYESAEIIDQREDEVAEETYNASVLACEEIEDDLELVDRFLEILPIVREFQFRFPNCEF